MASSVLLTRLKRKPLFTELRLHQVTRLTFTDRNANGIVDITNNPTTSDILQENHYYPFGMNYEGPWLMNDAARDTKYQHNSKELNDDFGLNWSDYGARWYDAAIGRWSTVDPMADKMRRWSPYSYAFDNPLRFIDLDGMVPDDTKRAKYEAKFEQKIGSKLRSMYAAGASEGAIKKAASSLADKYQNKNWFRFFGKEGGGLGKNSVGGAQGTEKGGKSQSTGFDRQETININPFPAATSVSLNARDGSENQAPNNREISTPLVAENGATVTAEFTPYSQPDELVVSGDGKTSQQDLVTSNGPVRSSDPAQEETFIYRTTVTSSEPLRVSVRINNNQESGNNPDRWQLKLTVQNPFTTNPYKIVTSSISGYGRQ